MDSFARHHSDLVFSLDLEASRGLKKPSRGRPPGAQDFDVEHFNSLLRFLGEAAPDVHVCPYHAWEAGGIPGEDQRCQYLDVVHDNAPSQHWLFCTAES